MLHAAAMLIGLFLLALLVFAERGFGEAATAAAIVAASCVLFAWRFGGVGATVWSAPLAAILGLARSGAIVAGALKTVRSALAADVTLQPALLRVKLRACGDYARAVMGQLASATPGAVVVEMEADAALVHVTNEDAVDAADLGAMEARVMAVLDGERRA